jgi:hypothetical protein
VRSVILSKSLMPEAARVVIGLGEIAFTGNKSNVPELPRIARIAPELPEVSHRSRQPSAL